MVQPRTWLAIPVMAVACAGLAFAVDRAPIDALAIGALAAAIAACVRAFAGVSVAAALAGGAAAVLGALCVLDIDGARASVSWIGAGGTSVLRAAFASAAAIFAIAELARPTPHASPLPAIGAALAAGALEPSFVALIAITGVRFVRGPWARPRWSIAVPVVGVLATVVALAAALTAEGMFAELWTWWAGRAGHADALVLGERLGDTLGPLAAVAALAGIAICARRGRFAAAAIIAALIGALATDVACGELGIATLALAAVTTGVAIGRLAATLHSQLAQPFVGAVAGFVIVIGPALYRW